MATYILVDYMNLAFRVRYGMRAPDIQTSVSLAIHTIFNSIKKVWNQFDGSNCVFAMEGRSWRKDYYQPYKAHRRELAAQRTQEEIDDDQNFFEAFNDLTDWLRDRTNATVLRDPCAEADDMIARWIHLHPHDQHVIVSTDSDFQQLLSENVKIYNGIAGTLWCHDGVYDKNGDPAVNKQGEPLSVPNPAWLLFEKIMRGDPGDNIMSAYPGVRKRKLQEAFDNRHQQGYSWNNLMLSRWSDHEGHEIKVKDAYERNRTLIDLKAQPPHLQQQFDKTIQETVQQPHHNQVGVSLIKFAHKWGLVRVEQHASDYAPCVSKPYQGHLLSSSTPS